MILQRFPSNTLLGVHNHNSEVATYHCAARVPSIPILAPHSHIPLPNTRSRPPTENLAPHPVDHHHPVNRSSRNISSTSKMLRSASKQSSGAQQQHHLLKHKRSLQPFSAGQLTKLLFEPSSGTRLPLTRQTLTTLPTPPTTTTSGHHGLKKSAAARKASATIQKKFVENNKYDQTKTPAKSSTKQFGQTRTTNKPPKAPSTTASKAPKAPSTAGGRRRRNARFTATGKSNPKFVPLKTPSKTLASKHHPKTPLPKAPVKSFGKHVANSLPPTPIVVASPPTIHLNLTRRLRACRTNLRTSKSKAVIEVQSTADQQRDLLWLRVRKFKLGIAEAKKDLEVVMGCDTKRRRLNHLIITATGGDEWVDEEEWGEPQEWWEEEGWDYQQEWGEKGDGSVVESLNEAKEEEESLDLAKEEEEKGEEIEIW